MSIDDCVKRSPNIEQLSRGYLIAIGDNEYTLIRVFCIDIDAATSFTRLVNLTILVEYKLHESLDNNGTVR